MMRVALLQIRVDERESAAERLDRVCALIRDQQGKADLVVLPELWLHGAFATQANLEDAQPVGGPWTAAMAQAASDAGVWLHAGSFPEQGEADAPYNTSLVLDPEGRSKARYRKIHLFGFDGGERENFSAGARPGSLNTPWGRLGLATCYDLRFPELFRMLVEQEVRGYLLPSGWPAARIGRWDVLAQARAIENQAFLFGVNAVGTNGGTQMGGRSVVVDPTGEVLALGSDNSEETLIVELDLEDSDRWRERFPALADRVLWG